MADANVGGEATADDTSVSEKELWKKTLDKVIPCWTEGVAMMKVGGKAQLLCPADIAYGETPPQQAQIPNTRSPNTKSPNPPSPTTNAHSPTPNAQRPKAEAQRPKPEAQSSTPNAQSPKPKSQVQKPKASILINPGLRSTPV